MNSNLLQYERSIAQSLRCFGVGGGVLQAFAQCAKVSGMLVVFKCREENTAMNKCIREHMTQAELDHRTASVRLVNDLESFCVMPEVFLSLDWLALFFGRFLPRKSRGKRTMLSFRKL